MLPIALIRILPPVRYPPVSHKPASTRLLTATLISGALSFPVLIIAATAVASILFSASIVPLLMILPDSISTFPLCSVTVPARTFPLLFTTVESSASAADALIITVPPSASMSPLFFIWAL